MISSCIVSRNRLATGYLPMRLGIWHFICLSHVDVKRISSRLGLSVSETAAKTALKHLADIGLQDLRQATEDGYNVKRAVTSTVIDNQQQYQRVFEHGQGREAILKQGTGGTAIWLENVAQGAFSRSDYIERVIANDRAKLTTEELYESIDWCHTRSIQAHHHVRALIEFVPFLNPLSHLLSKRFRTAPLAKQRMGEGRITRIQCLKSNAEKEMELVGMQWVMQDFDEQRGFKPEYSEDLLDWYSGDGGSYKCMLSVRRNLLITQTLTPESIKADARTASGKIFTPEVWHMRSTNLSTVASNHFGPAASPDPSSLSRSAAATGMHRPPDLKKCNFYPTSRSLNLFWNANSLDCWRY